MELTPLEYFLHVARAGSFVAGAGRAHVSPPAISKAIRKLEEELGTPLLVRTTRHVALTDAGRIVLERGSRVLDEVGALRQELQTSRKRVMARRELAGLRVGGV